MLIRGKNVSTENHFFILKNYPYRFLSSSSSYFVHIVYFASRIRNIVIPLERFKLTGKSGTVTFLS